MRYSLIPSFLLSCRFLTAAAAAVFSPLTAAPVFSPLFTAFAAIRTAAPPLKLAISLGEGSWERR